MTEIDALLPPGERFGAIVTDPPYGKRERVTGGGRWLPGLLRAAATRLRPGGRAVFWVPAPREHDRARVARALPALPACLRLEACCRQQLNAPWSRWLIVLERRPGPADVAQLDALLDARTTSADTTGPAPLLPA